jgi:hypothetical protein
MAQKTSRVQKIARLARKTFGERKITEQEADQLFEKYGVGQTQQLRGEIIAGTVEKFLAELPEPVRADLESSLRGLHKYSNFRRFRVRALVLLMTTYQNGSVSGKAFDVEGLVKAVAAEVAEKHGV